jgi:probable addiction module antidote protein
MRRNLDYKTDLLADLRDDKRFAAEYVSAAYADSQEAFLVALRDVAEAQKGIAKVAVGAKVNRENLYRMLSKEGNPRLSTLGSVLNALGMDLTVKLKPILGAFEQPHKPVPLTGTSTSETIATGSTNSGLIDQPQTPKESANRYYLTDSAGRKIQIPIENQNANLAMAA